jgi:hypothetical protein
MLSARPSYDDLNSLAARNLAAAVLPATWRHSGASPCATGSPLSEAVGLLCASPSLRLLSLLGVPQMPAVNREFTSFSWASLVKRLRQMLLTGASLEEGLSRTAQPEERVNRCAATVLTLRGKARSRHALSAQLTHGVGRTRAARM